MRYTRCFLLALAHFACLPVQGRRVVQTSFEKAASISTQSSTPSSIQDSNSDPPATTATIPSTIPSASFLSNTPNLELRANPLAATTSDSSLLLPQANYQPSPTYLHQSYPPVIPVPVIVTTETRYIQPSLSTTTVYAVQVTPTTTPEPQFGGYCSTLTAKGAHLPTTAQGQCGTILVVSAAGRNAEQGGGLGAWLGGEMIALLGFLLW